MAGREDAQALRAASGPRERPSGSPDGGPEDDDLSTVDLASGSAVQWILVIVLATGAFVVTDSPWRSGPLLHAVMEGAATTLALVVGALALVRYYSRKQGIFLFIGTGFLGTAVVDGFHAVVATGTVTGPALPGAAELSLWSWSASGAFLGVFLIASLLGGRGDAGDGASRWRELAVYTGAALLGGFTFVTFRALPPVELPLEGRAQALVPAVLLAVAAVGYLRRRRWHTDAFEHWLLIALIVGIAAHGGFMIRSRAPYDPMFDAAHGLRLVSYLAVLCGLLVSVYVTFRREAQGLREVRRANDALAYEVATRREAERVLQESEERLQHFLDAAHDLIHSTDPGGRILYVNRTWERTLGWSDKEREGLTIWELVRPEHRRRVREAYLRLMRGDDVGRTVVELRARDGRYVLCSGSSTVHRVDGRPAEIQGIFRDVTEQRQAERELAASRANVEALVENTGDAIWSVGLDHRLITFNSAFALAVEARSGVEPRRGDAPEDIFDDETAAWHRELYTRALRGRRFSEQLEEVVAGRTWYTEVFCNPITDEEGVTGAVMFGRDVTRRRRAEEALVAAKEEAVAANRAKSQFLANMSHELRTPLNSVIGFANILLKNKDGKLEEKQLGYLQRVQANGKHLLTLINDVLDLAKIEAGRMEVETEETDLAELIQETLAQLEGRVADRPVELVAEVPDGTSTVLTDPSKLKQVLINLVGNALKFTERGSVTVRVETSDPPFRHPLALHVVDTGIGIAKDRLEAIFEAFQQADGSTSRKYGGTGLGLAISRSICELLGYRMGVASDVGKGSTFSVHLGATVETAGGAGDAEGRPGSRMPHIPGLEPEALEERLAADQDRERIRSIRDFRVLVMDDESDSRVLLSHYLRDLGCTVLSASSAPQGIELARLHRPDLITLDLVMPDMDGWEALRALKDDPELREIPVVVVSMVAGEGGGQLLGAVDVLQKPVDRESLLRVLWRNLSPRRGSQVLVVDDDPDARELVSRVLEEEGLNVRSAANGAEALSEVEVEVPDAILLDLMMPVMDGFTFLDHLRRNPYCVGLPVIVLTARDLSAAELRDLREKATEVIGKDDALPERLQEVLGSFLSAPEA